ncbi:MAG: DUF5717 family protein [Lachnospiraceae bacterium]|nr:DUF5717 family protein [Lachnospiraceae bacterium]
MNQKVISYANEQYEYNPPKLVVNREYNFDAEAYKETEVVIECSNDRATRISGIAVSDDKFIIVTNPEFSTIKGKINVILDLKNVSPDTKLFGCIYFITDCGAAEVNINVSVKSDASMSKLDKLMEMSKSDFKGAAKLFKTKDFESEFTIGNESLKNIYKGLKKSRNSQLALEELLVQAGKEKVDFSVSQTDFVIENKDSFSCEISLTGWGYKEFLVDINSPVISTESMCFSSLDFTDLKYELKFDIDEKKLRRGYNYATITISSAYKEVTLNVKIVNIDEKAKNITKEYISDHRFVAEFLEFFIKYYSEESYTVDEGRMLEIQLSGALKKNDETSEFLRYFLDIVNHKEENVKKDINESLKNKDKLMQEEPWKYCLYNYLLMQCYSDRKDKYSAAQNIIECLNNGYKSWEAVSLLVLEGIEYSSDDELMAELLENVSEGISSPLIYMAVIKLINDNQRLFDDMYGELPQCLHWGARHGFLNLSTAERYAFFVKNQKGFSEMVFRDMCSLYRKYLEDEFLLTICMMLIRGHKTQSIYHEWYRLGVEKKLRITNLYENFIFSMDQEKQEKIPDIILDYFLYDNSMKLSQKSTLYSYIIRHKTSLKQVLESYNSKIERFALEQLENERISKNLGVIYEHYISPSDVDSMNASNLANIIFNYKLTCFEADIVGVYVRHDELVKEEFYPLIQGSALVQIYSDNYTIFLTDANGVRYSESVDYKLERLMKTANYIPHIFEYVKDNVGVIINMFENIKAYSLSTEACMDVIRAGMELDNISRFFMKKLYTQIFKIERDNPGSFEDILDDVVFEYIDENDEEIYVNYLISHCQYEKALKAINRFGFEVSDPKNLQKVLSSCLKIYQEVDDEELLKLAFFLYKKGRYDEKIIKYLLKNYVGNIDDMIGIYKVGLEKELSVSRYREKIIELVIISQSVKPQVYGVFHDMLNDKAHNRRLAEAFLNMNAYGYMLKGWVLPKYMFEEFKKNALNNHSEASLYAALKELSMRNTLDKNEKEFSEKYVRKLYEEDKIFAFFKNFIGNADIPEEIGDYYFIEYIADPDSICKMSYSIVNGTREDKYNMEVMENVFKGIRVKKMILFQDEVLQYYISEENNATGDEKITESRSISNDMTMDHKGPEDAFHILNTMLVSMEMRDDETFNNLMDEYAYKKSVCDAFANYNMKGKV